MRRFGLIGDVHAEDERLDAVLRFLAEQRVDQVICVGDLADGRGDLDRCVALLLAHRALVVRGNHDRWILADTMRQLDHTQRLAALAPSTRAYLEALPATRRVETAAGPLHLCHGLGKDDMLFVGDARALEFELVGSGYSLTESLARFAIEPDTRFLIGGHTHDRFAARVGALTLVNPGTLRREDAVGFAILEVGPPAHVRFFDVREDLAVMVAEEATP